jgi:hypothetical protein
MRKKFWRPQLYSEVKSYVLSCKSCQEYMLFRPVYRFDGCSAISGLFKTLFMDFVGPFPISNSGYQYIFVIVEQLSRFSFIFPCESQTSEIVYKILDKDIFPLISLPEKLVVDGGSCFTSPKFKSFCDSLGVKVEDNIAYQPEWMGTGETVNRVVRYALTKTGKDSFDQLDKFFARDSFWIKM